LYRTRFNSDSATTGEQHVYKSLFLSHPVQFRLCRDDREQHIICKCLFCCTRFNPDPDIIRSVNPDPAQDRGGGGCGKVHCTVMPRYTMCTLYRKGGRGGVCVTF
jgi:hypothetical protein